MPYATLSCSFETIHSQQCDPSRKSPTRRPRVAADYYVDHEPVDFAIHAQLCAAGYSRGLTKAGHARQSPVTSVRATPSMTRSANHLPPMYPDESAPRPPDVPRRRVTLGNLDRADGSLKGTMIWVSATAHLFS
jgi:hypothetical protein